jgi:hypothetical protein
LGKNDKKYSHFIRKGSSTVRAKGADETELLSLAATVPFNDRINQRAKVAESETGGLADVNTPQVTGQVTGQGGTKSAPSRNPEPMQGSETHRRSDGNSQTDRPHQVSEPSLEPASQYRIAGDDHSRQASQQQAERQAYRERACSSCTGVERCMNEANHSHSQDMPEGVRLCALQ